MRILYSHYLPSDNHPAARMVASISDELRSFGHDVFIHRSFGPSTAAADGSKAETAKSSEMLTAAKGRLWFAKAIARGIAMTKRDTAAIKYFHPDVVLARQDAYCWSMPKACLQLGVPLVSYADAPVAHETRLFDAKHRWHPPRLVESIERWGLKQSRAIVTVSHPAAELLNRYGLKVPIHVIHNGVHPQRFPLLAPQQRKEQRKALGLEAELIIAFQGTFRPFHGMDILRDLMLWSAAHSEVQWLLIGDGPQRNMLEDAVAGRVPAVFAGMQPAESVGDLLALVDVALVPHTNLGNDFYFCPLKILESAAAGCAVIAGKQGDIPLLLDRGRAGILVSGFERESWRKALRRVLDDEQYRRSLGEAARRFVLSNFTWRHTAKRVEEVLEQINDRKP